MPVSVHLLGHANAHCHAPHWLTSLRGARMAHGALSYTNAAAATDDGRVYTWGGNCWQGGIAAGRNATGPTEVLYSVPARLPLGTYTPLPYP